MAPCVPKQGVKIMKEFIMTLNNFECVTKTNGLRRLATAGFAFFLIKGLLWIIAAVWLVY